MNVYVLINSIDYGAEYRQGVLTDETRAKEWTKEAAQNFAENYRYGHADLEPIKNGYRVKDETFTYEEFELDIIVED
jgi:hypothetical protein